MQTFIVTNYQNELSLTLQYLPITPSSINLSTKALLGISDFTKLFEDEFCYIFILKNSDDIFNITPNFTVIKLLNKRAIIVSSPGFDNFDFYTRYFAPRIGVYEDPFCGSANCKVAPYWAKQLHKRHLFVLQASHRPGTAKLTLNRQSISISSSAITIGEMNIYNKIN
jgi:predicted PhzF superfamily epimerase YddE/YHI9